MWSAQDRYGTPSPGLCRGEDDAQVPCKQWFLTISNTTSAPAGSVAASERPQVFFSGNLHGDEWVGPPTLLELAELLVHGALPGPGFHPWLSRLVNTRTIVILVVSNPLGYDSSPPDRAEHGNDPNRDFPFEQAPAKCMLTTVARAINEAWREHIFQLAITFHGGMRAISYEWGAPNHELEDESPDDAAQADLGITMRDIAGSFNGWEYPVDRINSLVYSVHGGMEDWSYGGACSADRSAAIA